MTEPIDQHQFQEWIEQFANDTITPDDAERLLEIVRNDPEKLDVLCSQLQTDRLLEIMNKRDSMCSIAEVVLEKTNGMHSSVSLKKVRRSRTFLKVAASAAILLGLAAILTPRMGGRSELAREAQQRTDREYYRAESQSTEEGAPTMRLQKPVTHGRQSDVFYESEPAPAAKPAPAPVDAAKKKWKATAASEIRVAGQSVQPVAKGEALVALQVGYAESLDAGTPVQVEYDNLERVRSVTDGFSDHFGVSESFHYQSQNRENYAAIVENEFQQAKDTSLSTFSIDVDTASYANIRRFLTQGRLPPADAVRLEEMINYFEYDYEGPAGEDPFSTAMALTTCPWNANHQLLRIGLQGRKIDEDDRKPSNLVFLLDVSGSMNSTDKLPLLKKGFGKMIRALGAKDRVAVVVYAGSSGVVLDSTSATEQEKIIGAMNRLKAGGSTAGGAGIELAYRLAADHYIKDGINRVILATDGDFNVGVSNIDTLQKLIEDKRKSGVFLSVLGFGTGNLQDAKMEMLANKGNGNYFYIDSEREAEKVMVKQLTANMVTIAKDVKIQIEFNPALVRSYRLIGYENRILAARDFDDDTKDAGEIGAGHQVTALYEIVPAGAPAAEDGVELKYTKPEEPRADDADSTEMLTLKLRYKQPEGSKSKLLVFTLDSSAYRPKSMDESFRWATAIAAFGMHLRESARISTFPMADVIKLGKSAVGEDPYGYRTEALELMNKANQLKTGTSNPNDYPQWQYR